MSRPHLLLLAWTSAWSPVVDRATLSEMRGFVIANDAEGARVSFPQFDLRPDQEISLDVVHLLTWLPAERDISVEWTVTAMNADSANRGVISLRVGDLDIAPEVLLELRADER